MHTTDNNNLSKQKDQLRQNHIRHTSPKIETNTFSLADSKAYKKYHTLGRSHEILPLHRDTNTADLIKTKESLCLYSDNHKDYKPKLDISVHIKSSK